MINFLHTYSPDSIFFQVGNIKIHWYGVLIVIGIILSLQICLKFAEKYNISKDTIYDIAFWLILNGIIGTRLYHVLLEFPYYSENFLSIFKIWQGGLAIHGGIIAGIATIFYFHKKNKIDFWSFSALIAMVLSLSQAIGRWGNYFNQELYGKPTDLPWGIPIEIQNRLPEFSNHTYFHPTFLYESIGNLLIFSLLFYKHRSLIKKDKITLHQSQIIIITYFILYSSLRFSLEFIRIDKTPLFLGLRWPQIIGLLIIIASIIFLIKIKKSQKK